jgi:chemotaxis protein MotA
MEKSTIAGIGLGLFLIYGAIFLGDGVATFFDVASIIMVLGGTAAALMVSFSFDDLKIAIDGIKNFFSYQPPPMAEYVEEFTELSRMARREGLLALDRRLQELDDEFLKFGLEMAIDGVEESEIDELMKARIVSDMEDRKVTIKFFNTGGMFCPAFGMVGTLIGLVQMMQNLTDPSAIGQGMAVAMITTFYGRGRVRRRRFGCCYGRFSGIAR